MTTAEDSVQSYRERSPMPALASRVANAWVLEVGADGGTYQHRTVPNGSVEISYALGSDRVEVTGPQRGPLVKRVEPGTTEVGIRFRPGTAPSILGLPASELVDLDVDLEQLWGPGVAMLAEQLADASTPEGALRRLDAEIEHRLVDATALDSLIMAAVGQLPPWPSVGVGHMASDLYISARQLHRRFVAALGYGPKTLERILRFQGFIALAQGSGRDHVALLAQRAGYADQSHLIRECGALTGLTPSTFLDETLRCCSPTHDHEASYAPLRRILLSSR